MDGSASSVKGELARKHPGKMYNVAGKQKDTYYTRVVSYDYKGC